MTQGPRILITRVSDTIVISAPEPGLPGRLSQSEKDIVRAAIGGRSNAQIAQTRGTTTKTIANQLYTIYRKLGVNTRQELITYIRQQV